MLGTPTVRDFIKRNEFSELKGIMEKSEVSGMLTFDTALFNLVVEGAIDEDEALKNADSVNNLRLRLKLHQDGAAIQQKTPPAPPVAAQELDTKDWGLVDDIDTPAQ